MKPMKQLEREKHLGSANEKNFAGGAPPTEKISSEVPSRKVAASEPTSERPSRRKSEVKEEKGGESPPQREDEREMVSAKTPDADGERSATMETEKPQVLPRITPIVPAPDSEEARGYGQLAKLNRALEVLVGEPEAQLWEEDNRPALRATAKREERIRSSSPLLETDDWVVESTAQRRDEATIPKREIIASIENRRFLRVNLGGEVHRALFDPGAMVSVVGATIADRFKDRLEPMNTVLSSAFGNRTVPLGKLRVILDVDGTSEAISLRAMKQLEHEMILGMDFCDLFDIDAKLARGKW